MTQPRMTQTTKNGTSSASQGAHPGIPADLQGKTAANAKAAAKRGAKAQPDPMAGLVSAGGEAPGEELDAEEKAPPVVDPLAGMTDLKMKQEEERIMRQVDTAPEDEDELGEFDSLDGIEDMDVVPAPVNETLTQFENRIMAATVQEVDAIEVEPRIIQVLQRQRKLPREGFIVYRGIKLVIKGKLDEVSEAEERTTNDVLFPNGFDNAKLPEGVKGNP